MRWIKIMETTAMNAMKKMIPAIPVRCFSDFLRILLHGTISILLSKVSVNIPMDLCSIQIAEKHHDECHVYKITQQFSNFGVLMFGPVPDISHKTHGSKQTYKHAVYFAVCEICAQYMPQTRVKERPI